MKITIPIEVSARHLHLAKKDKNTLFGADYQLKKSRSLSQTGQYACGETVTVCHQDRCFEDVRIVCPARPETQIEISLTDAYYFKLQPPIRRSGNVRGSQGVKLIGPQGEVDLPYGTIVAQRHIHCDPKTAKKYHLRDGQLVAVRTSGKRAVVFQNVIVRLDPTFVWRFQIDTDEANAAGLRGGERGEVII